MKPATLGSLELSTLLTVARLRDDAYGLAVRRDLAERTGRDYSVGAVYTTLQRLEDKGFLASRSSDPLPVRGGRSRRHFTVTGAGARALRDAERHAASVWSGFPTTRMMPRVPPRASTPSPPLRAATYAASAGELFLHAVGADPHFIEAAFGDLAEEYALREARDGTGAARWWYGCEVLRSTPHFLRSWIRYASRYERGRLMAVLGGLALTSLVIVIAWPRHAEPPARLFAGASDTVVVNNHKWVQLPMEVLDSAGHVLHVTGVRYQQLSGAPLRMSESGRVTCDQRGDALVRAPLDALSNDFVLLCRPIKGFVHWTPTLWLNVGDPPQQLPISAIGLNGAPETTIAGTVIVGDTQAVSIHGLTLQTKRPGGTLVYVWIGGMVEVIFVSVAERDSSPAALRPGHYFAVSPLRLASGETRRWPLAAGTYLVSFGSDTIASAALTLSTVDATCTPRLNAYTYYCTASKGAAVVVSAPGEKSRAMQFDGHLAVEPTALERP